MFVISMRIAFLQTNNTQVFLAPVAELTKSLIVSFAQGEGVYSIYLLQLMILH